MTERKIEELIEDFEITELLYIISKLALVLKVKIN